jgi:hypothetical protein
MTETNSLNSAPSVDGGVADPEFTPRWSANAPRGGRTVLSRVLKDGKTVPVFLGQTLIRSLRDVGYNSTTSALCEHVDNSIQWGATEVRVYFHQRPKEKNVFDALVYDNGQGMPSNVLKVAMSFGGSMVYDNRAGIARFGMGMKTAALHLSRVLDVYTWQEPHAFYNLTLDVDAIGTDRSNMLEMPDPQLQDELPADVVDILTRPMVWPKNPQENQTLLANSREELRERLGRSGTIVYLPECDRLDYKKVQTLAEHAIKDMGRIYRRFIARGVKIYVNNRLVEAFDPTYSMPSARHTKVEGLTETSSRLVGSWPIDVPVSEGSEETTRIVVRLLALPYEAWGGLPRKVLKNDLHVYDDHTVSFMRNDREVKIGPEAKLKLKRHHTNNWIRLEIDFNGEADEGFTLAANKQGAGLKEYVAKAILEKIGEEVVALRKGITELKAKRAALQSGSKLTEAERRATDADPLQGKPLPPDTTAEDEAAMEANLRALAVTLKREGESDEQAYERIKTSRYLTKTTHDPYWPFYHCEFKFGKVILTLNTAHPFYQKVCQPLSELARSPEFVEDADEGSDVPDGVASTCSEVLVGIQLMLLSLARTQSLMTGHGSNSEHRQLFDKLRKEWSDNLETQLNAQ